MKKTKRNAVLVIIAFLLVLGVAIYTAIFGVADRGKVEYIKLGLDLKGGLSVTYEIQEDDYSDKDLEDTKYKIEKRVEAYTNEYSVYEDGDKKITAEIPGVTNADEILEALNIEGKLEFLDPDNYTSGHRDRSMRLLLQEMTSRMPQPELTQITAMTMWYSLHSPMRELRSSLTLPRQMLGI